MIPGGAPPPLGSRAHGGYACISVTANVAPKLCSQFQEACMAGNFEAARKLQDRLLPLHDAMFCEPSPAPAKFGASLLGLCANEVRLPIVAVTPAAEARIREAMVSAGLI